MPLLGAHMSVSGGLERALLRGSRCGCQVIQIFTRNPSQWVCSELVPKEIDAFQQARAETSIVPVAVHDSYLINLASSRNDRRKRSTEALQDELMRAHALDIPYVVIHPGAHLGDGETKGIERVSEGLNRVFDLTSRLAVRILLETTAGQGTSLGYRFEQLAEIIQRSAHQERLGVCLDTCHIFAAGYDVRDRRGFERVMRHFDAVIGLNRLKLIHINDSKRKLGSRVDRHEHIGQGLLGTTAFSFFLRSPLLKDLPFLLETPKETDPTGKDMDVVNLSILRQLTEGHTIHDCI